MLLYLFFKTDWTGIRGGVGQGWVSFEEQFGHRLLLYEFQVTPVPGVVTNTACLRQVAQMIVVLGYAFLWELNSGWFAIKNKTKQVLI